MADRLDHLNHLDHLDHLGHWTTQSILTTLTTLTTLTKWTTLTTLTDQRFIKKIIAEFKLFAWSILSNSLIEQDSQVFRFYPKISKLLYFWQKIENGVFFTHIFQQFVSFFSTQRQTSFCGKLQRLN